MLRGRDVRRRPRRDPTAHRGSGAATWPARASTGFRETFTSAASDRTSRRRPRPRSTCRTGAIPRSTPTRPPRAGTQGAVLGAHSLHRQDVPIFFLSVIDDALPPPPGGAERPHRVANPAGSLALLGPPRAHLNRLSMSSSYPNGPQRSSQLLDTVLQLGETVRSIFGFESHWVAT